MKSVFAGVFVFFSILVVSVSAPNATLVQEQIARSLGPELDQFYISAVTAFQNKDFPAAAEKYESLLKRAKALGNTLGIALGLAGQGAVSGALQHYSSAHEMFSAALPYLTNAGSLEVQGWVYAALGEVYLQLDNPRQAINSYDKALSIGQDLLANRTDEETQIILSIRGEVYRQKAMAHERLEHFDEAVNTLLMAATDFESVKNKNLAAMLFWKAAALLHYTIKKPKEAIGAYLKASSLYEELGEIENLLLTRLELGWSHREATNLTEAISVFASVVEVARREASPDLLFQGQFSLSVALENAGEFRPALKSYQALLDQFPAASSRPKDLSEAKILVEMAKIYRLLSEYEQAIEHFHLAAARSRESNESSIEATALTNLADTFWWFGDFNQAHHYYSKGLAIYKSDDNLVKQIEVLAALAEAAHRSDDLTAEERDKHLLDASKTIKLVNQRAGVDLEALWQKRREIMAGEPEEQDVQWARDYQQDRKRSGQSFEAALLHWQVRKSKEFFTIWQASAPSLGAEYLFAVGTLYQKWGIIQLLGGDPKTAKSTLHVAERYFTSLIFDREVAIEWGKTWFFLAEAYRQLKDFEVAISYFEEAFLVGEYLRTPEIHWIYAGGARTFADMGDYERALTAYRRGLEQLETVQNQRGIEAIKIGILEGSAYIYRHFIELLLDLYNKKGRDQSYLLEAFEYTQKGKARAFLETFSKVSSNLSNRQPGPLAKKDEEIQNEISKIHHYLRNPKLERDKERNLLDRLDKLRQEWRTLHEKATADTSQVPRGVFSRPVTVQEVQSVLNDESVLLEYLASEKGLILWVITKDQLYTHTLTVPNGKDAVNEYLQSLRTPLVDSDELKKHIALSKELYRALLGPAEKYLRGKKQLIIAPDGPLYYLPFEALIVASSQDGATTASTPADIPYLIRQFQVSYIPSASVLVAQHKQEPTQRKTPRLPLVAFGDPIYQGVQSVERSDVQFGRIANIALRGRDLKRLKKFLRMKYAASRVCGTFPLRQRTLICKTGPQ